MGTRKRWPALPKAVYRMHEQWSKATIHEALLDLWMETNGIDVHPSDLTEQQLNDYAECVKTRSESMQRNKALRVWPSCSGAGVDDELV